MIAGGQPPLAPGHLRFYDAAVPALGAGDYVINAAQHVHPTEGIDESHAVSQAFSIAGPRFSLPPEDVFSVFPPPGAGGNFDEFFPQVVFTERHLPWERNVFPGITPQPPWLALLVFSADPAFADGQAELLKPEAPGTPDAARAVTVTEDRLVARHSGDGIAWPKLAAEWYEGDLEATPVRVIDITPNAFRTLLPAPAMLRYLAHVRQVNSSSKDETVLGIAGHGWYSAVAAGRLPAGRSIVHLVSLEGLADYLTDPEKALKDAAGNDAQRVRLVSLLGWTFTCLPDPGVTFAAIARGLVRDAGGPRRTAFTLSLAHQPDPAKPAQQVAASAIARGYVPLQYDARGGEQTFALYRGPFTPVPVASFTRTTQIAPGQADAGWRPFGTASAALVYDAGHGIYDVSYAVAWETGRALALADAAFSQELLDWERDGHALVDLLLERDQQLGGLDAASEQELLALIQPYALTDPFITHLLTELGPQLVPPPSSAQHPDSTQPSDGPQPQDGASPRSAARLPAYRARPAVPATGESIDGLLSQPAVQQVVRTLGGQELDDIADWLARRQLLDGVPFEALVPRAEMLPPESVRFFYLDPNWLDALLEGALSIGIESSRDTLYQDLMKDLIWDAADRAVRTLRARLLADSGITPPDLAPAAAPQLAGMLLRSAAVAGWPGLEARGFGKIAPASPGSVPPQPDPGTLIPALRIGRLASDVLCCLWPAVPAIVTIDEPHEGVCFGFEDGKLRLRSLGADYGTGLGGDAYTIDATEVIDGSTRVLDLGQLRKRIAAKLPAGSADQPVTGDELAVRDVAMQLVKVPDQAVFAPPEAAPR